MKAVIVGIIVLFLSIFGAVKFREIQRVKKAEDAKESYEKYITKRKKQGEIFDKATFLKKISEDYGTFIFEDPIFQKYLTEEGYDFDLSKLQRAKKFGEQGSELMFSSSVGRFGPNEIAFWKRMMNPPIQTNPTDRMLAAKVLHSLDEWRGPLNTLNDTVFRLAKENDDLSIGLHLLRGVEAKEQEALYGRIEAYFRANCTYGRLQFYKGSKSHPYDVAKDLLNFVNMAYVEAIEPQEVKLVSKLNDILLDYILFLSNSGGLSKALGEIEILLADDILDQALFNNLQMYRIEAKMKTEKEFENLTKQTRLADSIFEDLYVMTPEERWVTLKLVIESSERLNFNPNDKSRYEVFTPEVHKEFVSFAQAQLKELSLNTDALERVNMRLYQYEKHVFELLENIAKRDAVATRIAAQRYKQRVGKFPTSVQELTSEDIATVPMNPLTGRMYKGDFTYLKKSKNSDEILESAGAQLNWTVGGQNSFR